MTEQNSVRYGLSNVHVGLVETSENATITFTKPEQYPGAVNLTLDPEGEQSIFYADNIAYYVTNSNNGYTGEIEMAIVPSWFETKFLGSIESNEGMIVETANVSQKMAYMMFQFEGDINATKYIIYNMRFNRPSLEGKTQEDTTEPDTSTIPFTSVPLKTEFGNIVRAKVPVSASNYETFFTDAPTVPTKKSV